MKTDSELAERHQADGRRGDSGLTTLEWLLIVAAVAGLAALAVVLVQRVVSDTSEQIAGNSARQTAAKVAGTQVTDKARAAGLETGANHTEINQDGKRECDRLKILYSDAGITTTYTDGVFAGSVWTTDPNCQVTASGDTATPATPGQPQTLAHSGTTLTWAAPTSIGGSPITGYVIECMVPGGSTATCGSRDTNASSGWTITAMGSGQMVTYTVAARNTAGLGPTASVTITLS